MQDIHWTGKVSGIAFTIGSRSVAWYGIFITCAMVLALFVCMRRMKQRTGTDSDQMLTLFLIAIPCAIVAARLGYVVANYKEYFQVTPYDWNAFVHTIAIWEGGLTILWGVPGGVLGGIVWCKIYHKNFWQCADIILPVALLAQALGRWGNFMNQELYGQVVTNPAHQWFPLATFIAADMQWHQATFFYEFVLNLVGFFLLSYLYKRVDVRGFGLLSYFGYYTLVRAILEFFRVETNSFDGAVNSTQLICFIIFSLCAAAIIFLMCWKKFKKKQRVFYAHGYPLEFPAEPEDLDDETSQLSTDGTATVEDDDKTLR